jgi:hypothetical protein
MNPAIIPGRQPFLFEKSLLSVRWVATALSALLLSACGAANESHPLSEDASSMEGIRAAEALDSGGDDGSGSEGDRRAVKALVRFAEARDEETMADVPVGRNGLWLGLADRLMVRRSARELADPKVWRLRAKLFRAYIGPFSALDLLADSGPTVISVGSHPHCASPPVPPPADVAHLRRVSVQPRDIESCLQWFTVDLFLTPGRRIAAVTLDLWEP